MTYRVKSYSNQTQMFQEIAITRFLYKNQVYKNVEAQILPKIKKRIRTSPGSNFVIFNARTSKSM